MRRTFTLIMLVLCFTTFAFARSQKAGDKGGNSNVSKNLASNGKETTTKVTGNSDKQKTANQEVTNANAQKKNSGAHTVGNQTEVIVTQSPESNGEGNKPLASPATLPRDALDKSTQADDENSQGGIVKTSPSLISQWLPLAATLAPSLLALGLVAFAFVSLAKARREAGDSSSAMRQSIANLKSKQDTITKQLEGMTAANGDLSARVAELNDDLRDINSQLQSVRAASSFAAATMMSSGGNGVPEKQKEAPAFPITADAYLRKMQRSALVVKPDFQNGILIPDAENKGELAVVRDTSISNDSLFVVPRVPQFQTRQDFHTYYENYYECERPTAGTVWIVDPAVVVQVQGGWTLREKGVLEVR